MNDFTVTRVGLNLIISVRFPITVLSSSIQIFRAISIKTPLSYESSDCTELSGLPWGIGISRDDPIYLIFNEKPPLDKSVIYVKKVDINVMSTDYTSCIWALFSNSRIEIKTYCEYHLIPNGLKPEIRNLGNGNVLLTKTENVTLLTAPDRGEDIAIANCAQCIVKIVCGYHLMSKI
jgi:hypothetical protein